MHLFLALAAFGLPVLMSGEVYAVLEFFSAAAVPPDVAARLDAALNEIEAIDAALDFAGVPKRDDDCKIYKPATPR